MELPENLRTSRRSRVQLVAFFGALSLFFATIEYLFPKPLPFFRLGLSNLPMLVALDFFTLKEQFLLFVLKVVGQGLVNGTLASYVFLFSTAGSLASFVVMVGLHRLVKKAFAKSPLSLIGVSLAGSMASNCVQILLSIYFIFGPASGIIAPIFFGLGTLSGFLVGWGAQLFVDRSHWLRRLIASGA